jgi:CubicO group peptidase (beta-lactamase class C family)
MEGASVPEGVERAARVVAEVIPDPIFSRQPDTVPLEQRMAALSVPGVGIAVIDGGEIAWARGFGRRDEEQPVTSETIFQAGSISKPVAAMGVMTLVQAGQLDLDEDVNAYLRSWRVPANGDWQPRITLRHLLCHGAGTTVHGFPGYNRQAPVPTVPQILNGLPPANTRPVRVNAIPGTQFRYSGGGTTIVQQLVEDVTAERFPAFMHASVLAPLGMTRSTYEQPLPAGWWENAAAGYRMGGGMIDGRWHIYPEMAAAGLWTTPTDLARVAIDMQQAWAGQPGTLLRPELAREMFSPQVEEHIGLGFFLEGVGRFGHSGSDEGFMSELIAYREGGRGAVVMTNADWGGFLRPEVFRAIAREYEWPDFEPAVKPAIKLAAQALAPYAGTYELKPGFAVEVIPRGNALFLQPSGQAPVRLYPSSETEFFAEALNIEVRFSQSGEGTLPVVEICQNERWLTGVRLEDR